MSWRDEADRDSELEIQLSFGRAVITMLAHIDGHAGGIIPTTRCSTASWTASLRTQLEPKSNLGVRP
jgi:hypothetical protein